jgi:hypothetical protein
MTGADKNHAATPAVQEIDRIVREVMRRLVGASSVAPRTVGRPNVAVEAASLRIDERVVSMATLDGRLDGVRRLIVPARAVVTPAVKDRLRERNIELIRRDASPTSAPPHASQGGLLVVNLGSQVIDGLLADLPCDAQQLRLGSLPVSVERLADELADGERLGLVVTDAPEAAACLANRHASLRAVCGRDRLTIERAAVSMAANVLVFDAASLPMDQARAMLHTFLTAARRIDRELQTVLA